MYQSMQRMASMIADRVWFISMRARGDRIAGCYVMIPPAPDLVHTMPLSARVTLMSLSLPALIEVVIALLGGAPMFVAS
jgi:hypothetical protein